MLPSWPRGTRVDVRKATVGSNSGTGPYLCPRVRVGGRLFCENLGTVRVCKFSDGPIPWPLCIVGERGGPAYVLCGDLVKAVRLEVATAVARAWGVHPATVGRWRRRLGVEQFNPGTHDLFVRYQGKGLTAETRARGRAAQNPERQSAWAAVRRRDGRTRKRRWTPEEEALLGTMPDAALAGRLGCHPGTVMIRRRELGVPTFVASPLVAASLRAAGRDLVTYSPEKLAAVRLAAGLFQTQVAERAGWKTPDGYARLERGGRCRATPDVLARVAAVLGCRVDDLLP